MGQDVDHGRGDEFPLGVGRRQVQVRRLYVKYGIDGTENVIFPKDNRACVEAVPFIRWYV